MQLQFLGGAGEIGRSALLVDDSLLVDYGMAADDPPRYPVGDPDPDAVVVSHGHLDHVGALPALLAGTDRPAIHWTPPTAALARTLARDTLKLHGGTPRCPFSREEVLRLGEVSRTHGYHEPFEAAGYTVTFHDAGHVPGSAHVLVDDGNTRLLYTGDFHTGDAPAETTGSGDPIERSRRESPGRPPSTDGPTEGDGAIQGQRLVAPTTDRPPADVVVTEATYAAEHHPPRAAVERRFVERVRRTRWEGGTVVVPAFAIGRTQELMLVCAAHDLDPYVDGMGVDVTRLFQGHPAYLRDADALRRAASNARFVDGRDGQRERIAEGPAVVITTAGMLTGGPAMTYVPLVARDPVNAILFAGHQVAGTPGRRVLETGGAEFDGRFVSVSATVEAFEFSAHADDGGLRGFLDAYRDARILVVHGDATGRFADRLAASGHDADAPAVGETVVVGESAG